MVCSAISKAKAACQRFTVCDFPNVIAIKLISYNSDIDHDEPSQLCQLAQKNFCDKKFCLFLHENMSCGYSLEAPRRGASNEYPQLMFLSLTVKKYL